MNKNDFKPFAAANNANVTTQSEWENLSVLLSGFISGKASSGQINKALRQATVMACVLAQYISDTNDTDVLDDGDISGLVQKLKNSINSIARVTSVNNKTGAVTLGASDVNAFPSKGGTVGGDGVTTPGLLVNGSNLPINGQGVHLAWNESGSNGEGNLICNKGRGQGGFVLRTVNVDNTTETGRVTISGNGDLNTSRYLSEAGQRVYSPNNPPPVNITGAVTGVRLSGRTVVADTGGRINLPSGCVFTGMSGANYPPSAWAAYSAVQVNINGVWATVATV